MPRSSTKSLSFPLGGVSRRGPYRQQTRPYSAPGAVNVRTTGPSELRKRGGSRPGLAKLCPTDLGSSITALVPVTYIDSSDARQHDLVYVADGVLGYIRSGVAYPTTAELEDDNAVDIFDDNGVTIDFNATVSTGAIQGAVRNGKVYFADTVLKAYSPATGVVDTVAATDGTVPTGQTLVAIYRDRVCLSGEDHKFYISRYGDPGDWNDGAAIEDPGGAYAGQLSTAGHIGDAVTAMIAVGDDALVLATATTLWVIRGDPRTGRQERVSGTVGIVAANAWAISPEGLLAFLSHDGVYLWDPTSRAAPVRFSAERTPDELREVTTSTNTFSMAYDSFDRGFHLFVTPDTGTGTNHWWIDPQNKAFWPQRFSIFHQPLSAALLDEDGLGNVVIGSQDGYVRQFLSGQADDDGEDLESHVLIGPVRISADDVRDALLAEIHGVMEDITNTGSVTWRVVMGRSAAEASELALSELDLVLDGQPTATTLPTGTWTEGRGYVSRPRSRGAWLVVWLSSTDAWSYEVIAIVARQLGRHR